jgi:OOP family OmpA-OmpF porin
MTRVLVVLLLLVATAAADSKSKLFVLDGTKITFRDPVHFEFGKPVIKRESYAQLDALAAMLKSDASIKLLEVQAHTDERGDDKYNLEITQKRAEAVRVYLIKKGIAGTRLVAQGYGETQPIDAAHTEAAWAKNRRVAFLVLKR